MEQNPNILVIIDALSENSLYASQKYDNHKTHLGF